MLGMCLYSRVFVCCETVYTSGCMCVYMGQACTHALVFVCTWDSYLSMCM